MKKKTSPSSKRTKTRVSAAIAAVASLAIGSYVWISFNKSHAFQVPSYTASRVIDGDTFVTTEKQVIRLASTEAPELDYCGGVEAKEALEKLVMGKPLYIKLIYLDQYRRHVGLVYTESGYINEQMIRQGYAYFEKKYPDEGDRLKSAGEEARQKKRRIYSSTCTQSINSEHPTCTIKGNTRDGDKIYYTPECTKYYAQTDVQLYKGDQWFCTEKEADKAGFRRAKGCEG